MTFDFEVGDEKKTHVSFYRNWFTGTLRIKANGALVVWRSALNPLTHFSVKLTRAYSFHVENDKEREVVIVQVRPLFLAGFRPQTYIVLWKGNQIAQYTGY
jgi:hypothetical protein